MGNLIVFCPSCRAKNRVPRERLGEKPLCGRCRSPLPSSPAFPEGPVEVFDWNFRDEVLDIAGPVLVEFYSPAGGIVKDSLPSFTSLPRNMPEASK
jgi:thioredoxin 2